MAKRLPKKNSRAQKPLTEKQMGSVSGGGLGRAFHPGDPVRTPGDPIRNHPTDPIRLAPGDPVTLVDPIKQG